MNTGLGSGLLEIAGGLMGIALIALLINRSKDTSRVIQSGGGMFNTLLRTVTLQDQFGGGFNSNQYL